MSYVKIDRGLWNNDFSVSKSLNAISQVKIEDPIVAPSAQGRAVTDGTLLPVTSPQNDHIVVSSVYIACSGGATAELGFIDAAANPFEAKIVVPADGTVSLDGIKLFHAYAKPGSTLWINQTAAGAVECYVDGYHVSIGA